MKNLATKTQRAQRKNYFFITSRRCGTSPFVKKGDEKREAFPIRRLGTRVGEKSCW